MGRRRFESLASFDDIVLLVSFNDDATEVIARNMLV